MPPAPVNTQGVPLSQASGSPVPQAPSIPMGGGYGQVGSQTPPAPLLTTSAASRSTTSQNMATLTGAVNNAAAGNAVSAGQTTAGTGTATPGSGSTATPGGGTGIVPVNPTADQLANRTTDATKTPADSTGGTDDISAAVSGLPPSLQKLYGDNIANLQQEHTDAKATLVQAQATLANDPAATAAVNAISAKYDVLIQAMQLKNKQVLGKASSAVGAFGGLGVMNQSFLSNQMDAAQGRISNIISQQTNATLAAQAAYGKQDLAAFNSAMDNYNKTISDMNTALRDLSAATDKQIKDVQAQAKIDAAAQKQAVTTDISKSANLGTSLAKTLSDAGITDENQVNAYVQKMAEQYGITDPEILKSAVITAQQTTQKANDAHANTVSTIAKRNQPKAGSTKGSGTDGTYKYTSDDVSSYSALLNQGGQDPNGTAYGARGTDGYVDPGAYVAALNDWTANGGTPAGFAKKFPVKSNINPTSYAKLPAAIRPAAASVSAYSVN